jgi:hypothetical protein
MKNTRCMGDLMKKMKGKGYKVKGDMESGEVKDTMMGLKWNCKEKKQAKVWVS